jgi:hypothetical protein
MDSFEPQGSAINTTALSLKCCYLGSIDMIDSVLDGTDGIERILMGLAMELMHAFHQVSSAS